MTTVARRSSDSLAIEPVPIPNNKPPEQNKSANLVTAQPPIEKKPASAEKPAPSNDVVAFEDLRGTPQYILCPYCKMRQKTRVEHKLTDNTCKASLVCCVIGCVVGSIVPCVCRCFSDTNHYCEACGKLVARKPDGGEMEAVPVQHDETYEKKPRESALAAAPVPVPAPAPLLTIMEEMNHAEPTKEKA
ncbi:hypothetical protein QBC43DRAFT_359833 [Cladorrhinum sp. PSN259]|nr:hypothetical protein QBC43DRAFT_359833 [Cladorrhinum sp. PSN259]